MKKILAFVLAMIMVMAMGTVAFADGQVVTNGATTSTNNSVTIKKGVKVTNYSGYAYEPTITYTYTLSDGNPTATVTDKDGNVATIKPGLTSYLATDCTAAQTAVYSSATAVTSGQTIYHDVTWTFDPAKFPSAGVYRFVITETSDPVDPTTIGISRPAAYDKEKFLDVYVKNGTTAGTKEIYGYAFVDDETTDVVGTSAKSTGWETGDDLDEYNTYNITITKHIAGDGADMTAKFPFKVELTGEMSNANIVVADGTGESISAWALTDGTGNTADKATVTGNLGDRKTIVIKGLPITVKYTVAEANPTPDKYKIQTVAVAGDTATGTTGDLAGKVGNDVEYTTVVGGGDVKNATKAITVDVTNYLGTISPTGVVMRVAPFAIMLGAGVVLLVLSKKRKSEN